MFSSLLGSSVQEVRAELQREDTSDGPRNGRGLSQYQRFPSQCKTHPERWQKREGERDVLICFNDALVCIRT
jgi:hypothetical protein